MKAMRLLKVATAAAAIALLMGTAASAVTLNLHNGPDPRTLDPGILWGGWRLPVPLELGLVAALAVIALVFAGIRFSRTE